MKKRNLVFCLLVLVYLFAAPVGAVNSYSFEDDFDAGTVLWNTDCMHFDDGFMKSNSASGFTTANLYGTAECYSKNMEINARLSITGSGWLMINFRKSENILLGTNRVCRYNGSETWLDGFSFKNENYYNVKIIAIDEKVTVDISDDNGKSVKMSYITDNLEKCVPGIRTYNMLVSLDRISIKSLDENEVFEKSIVSAQKGDTFNLISNSAACTLKSSDEAIVKVNENKSLTAISNGSAVVTIENENGDIDSCTVVVLTNPKSATMNQEISTLCVGDAIGVGINLVPVGASDKTLIWETSNKNVVEILGKNGLRKTLNAVSTGAAELTIKDTDQNILYSNTIIVVPEKEDYITSSYGTISDIGIKIPEKIFGIHMYDKNLGTVGKDVFGEFGFTSLRTMQSFAEKFENGYEMANINNAPHFIALDIVSKTPEELVEYVCEMREGLTNSETIYVELGNELYSSSDVASAESYANLCRPVYTALKEYAKEQGFDIKIGASYLTEEYTKWFSSDTKLGGWNSYIKQNTDFYDAIVVHNYTTFDSEDGYTKNQAMEFTFGHNSHSRKMIDIQNTDFPDKEIWYTEYGFLLLDLFNQTDISEKNRLQFAKTADVAVTNIEKFLDMVASGNVDMSAFHCYCDSQGFGIVQNDKYLPNFHVFKRIGELVNNYEYIYSADEIYADTHGENSAVTKEYKTVGLWGFGNKNSTDYAVIINRAPNSQEFGVEGYKLDLEWSYGSDKVLEGFMLPDITLPDVPEPIIHNAEDEKTIVIPGYSISVVKLKEDSTVKHNYINITENLFNPLTDKIDIKVYTDISLEENGKSVAFSTFEKNNGTYEIVPVNGFMYDTEYKIIAGDTARNFTTVSKQPYDSFENVLNDDFSSNSGLWNYLSNEWDISNGQMRKKQPWSAKLETKESYEDFVMTVDIILQDEFEYSQIKFRNGMIRLYHNGYIRSYFNGKNDVIMGSISATDDILNLKIIAYKEFAFIFCKNDSDRDYSYIGRISNISDNKSTIVFEGSKYYSIDNVKISSYTGEISDIKYFADSGIELSFPIVGSSKIHLSLKNSDSISIAAIKKGNVIKEIEFFDNGELDITLSDGDAVQIFVWDSFGNLKPLSPAYTAMSDKLITDY